MPQLMMVKRAIAKKLLDDRPDFRRVIVITRWVGQGFASGRRGLKLLRWFAELSERDVHTFAPILTFFLKRKKLSGDKRQVAIDALPRLHFNFGDQGLQPRQVQRMGAENLGPIDIAQAAGNDHFLLFQIREMFRIASRNGGKLINKNLQGLTQKGKIFGGV
jgi:hypothetical protein